MSEANSTTQESSAAAAQTPKVPKGARVSGVLRSRLAADICQHYRDGQSIRSLAAETGRSYGFVHGLLVSEHVPLRGRGGATRKLKQ